MTNILFTNKPITSNSAFYVAQILGTDSDNILDTQGDYTQDFIVEGFKNHEYSFEVANIGTSVVVSVEVQLAPDAGYIEVIASSAITANGVNKLSYTGFAYSTRLVLKTITGGTPAIRNITAVAYDRY